MKVEPGAVSWRGGRTNGIPTSVAAAPIAKRKEHPTFGLVGPLGGAYSFERDY